MPRSKLEDTSLKRRGTINPYPAKLIYFNFQPFEVVSRYRDPQLQVVENYSYLFNYTSSFQPNINEY